MQKRPNILFILTDQQNANMMSCVGNPYLHTPALDNLAKTSIRFERTYCANPVCAPSRFTLMTGRMPSEIGMFANNVSHIPTISEKIRNNGLGWLMQRAGYDVAYAGKVHLPRMTAIDVGFEYLCKDEREELPVACAEFIKRKHEKPFFLVASLINPHDICYMAITDFAQTDEERSLSTHSTVACATMRQALQRPEGVDEETFLRDHCPPLPPNFEPQDDEPEAIEFMLEQRPFRMNARKRWSDLRWREHRWAYSRLTEVVDAQIARLMNALEESGLMDETLIIFTSDHGDMDASHRMEHKSTLYEEACHVPLIVRPPGGVIGRVDTSLVSNGLDLLPTFCDYAGIEPPDELKGQSLRPIIDKTVSDRKRSSVPIECAIGRALVTERFKYAVYDMGGSNEQLYDLQSDPFEQRNALNDTAQQQIVEALRQEFNRVFTPSERSLEDVRKDAAKG